MSRKLGIATLACVAAIATTSAAQTSDAPSSQVQAPGAQPAAAPVAATIVGYTHRDAPASFSMMTAGHAMFAGVGGLAAGLDGPQIAKKFELADPANFIAQEVARSYAEARHDMVAPNPIAIDEAHKVVLKGADKFAADIQGAAFVVDARVSTTAIYFPLDWSHYGLIFAANVQVVDTSNGKVVAKARCFQNPQKTPDSPTNEQLFADNASVLKKMMVAAAENCVPKLEEALQKP
jgi:hypothetical protein